MKNGVIILEGGERLPEGCAVRVEPLQDVASNETDRRRTVAEIRSLFGRVAYWPEYNYKVARKRPR